MNITSKKIPLTENEHRLCIDRTTTNAAAAKMGDTNDWFRVKIILSNYFDDHKSKAYVSVNKQWKNVRQFHKHLEEIFGLSKFILTTNENIYLPGKFILALCHCNVMASIIRNGFSFNFQFDYSLMPCAYNFPAKENISVINRGDTIV